MPIKNIKLIENVNKPKLEPIKEVMNIELDTVDKNISRRNGGITLMCGSGGSGKSSLLLNMFKSKKYYRGVFDNIYYFCPSASFLSVQNHPFKNHPNVYHELNDGILNMVYDELVGMKEKREENIKKNKENKMNKKNKKTTVHFDKFDNSESGFVQDENEEDLDEEIKYNCIIIDDFGDLLKNNDLQKTLSKMLIKARHLCTAFIFVTQGYLYFPKLLRKQITYLTQYKTNNIEEWKCIAKEVLNYNDDDALTIFNYVFDKPYNHMDIDLVGNKVYKNFDLLEIEK